MNEMETSEDVLLLNKNRKKKPKIEFDLYKNASVINEDDINTLSQQLNNLPSCLNEFLKSKILKNPNGISLLYEIYRKNLKIKMYQNVNNYDFICQWCKENCWKYFNPSYKEKDIFEINCNFCDCGKNEHKLRSYNKESSKSDDNIVKNEINKLKENNSLNKEEKKKYILKLIEGKESEKILQSISYMMKIKLFNINEYKYDDEIFLLIFSCFKKPDDPPFYEIIDSYFKNFIADRIEDYNPPLFNFKKIKNNKIPALYYNLSDSFSYSFFFQVYRKKIVTKSYDTNEVISFLKKNKISKDILINQIMYNTHYDDSSYEELLHSYGFFSLDLLLENTYILEFDKKDKIMQYLIYILFNQNCDIFSDFMYNGETKRTCLVDIINYFSKIFYEKIHLFVNDLDFNISDREDAKILKNELIYFPFFRLSFYDENKQRILNTLSAYSFSKAQNKNIFKDSDSFSDIFYLIEKKIINIVKRKQFNIKKSEQNLLITKKLLDLYKLKYENIKELNSFNFNFLIQNLIEKDFPIQLADKLLYIIEKKKNNENNELKTHFDYIIKITLLFCTNIVGSSYIYNSNFIPKILKILSSKIDFFQFSNFFFEMLFILKICFNRKIIDISFFQIKNEEKSINLKIFLFYILFGGEPIIENESFFYFYNFDVLLKRIKSKYKFIFNKENNIFLNSFENINPDESYLNIIKTIVLNMKTFDNQKINNIKDINEKTLENQIEKEIKKIKTKIPGFIVLDILRCLENLNQTNFYLEFEEETFFDDKNNDFIFIFSNKNLPFAVKSLILNFLIKYVLTLKIDVKNNKILGPLLNNNEKLIIEKWEFKKHLNQMNESEKHLNETIKLMNILILCI